MFKVIDNDVPRLYERTILMELREYYLNIYNRMIYELEAYAYRKNFEYMSFLVPYKDKIISDRVSEKGYRYLDTPDSMRRTTNSYYKELLRGSK